MNYLYIDMLCSSTYTVVYTG